MNSKLIVLLGLLFLASCAHHRDVRPGADGIHRVVVATEDTDAGARDAISQANHYCKEKRNGMSAAFVNEESKYTGSMDEKTYKTAKVASKVAQAAGGAAYVFGGRNERTAGGVVGLGGGIADGVLGKGYSVNMQFKCQ